MSERDLHFQRVLEALQAVRRLPSISAGVLSGSELTWTGHAGEGGGADVQYRIGSITKTMTAVLVLQARDHGLFDLDDALGRFIPESAYADVTLRQLLSHTGGLPSEPAGDWWERSAGQPIASVISSNTESVWPAGAGFHYSNLGYGLLGEVVARIAGSTWAELLRDRIWAPLGMTRTTLLPQQPAATGWSVHHLRGTLHEEPATDTDGMAAAGQVWSTVADLALFAGFLLRGHEEVLSPASIREMAQPVDQRYGLGLRLDSGLIGHNGSMPGFQAGLFVDAASGEGAVMLTNATTGVMGHDVAGRLLGQHTPGVGPAWFPSASVPDWAEELLGYWHWGNSAHELRWHNGRLEFHDLARGLLAEQFEHHEGRIVGHAGYHHGETLRVVRNPDGSINHLNCATFIYTREPYDARAPIPGG